ncbi:MAG: ATP-binding protein, partial [Bdellovibrionota bacterium]|nr:ATP-binding protein [Bdellovibrionota bacterium]
IDLNKEIEIKIYPTDRTFNMKTYSHFFSTLIHILRNALDHGIEEKVYRKEAGKKEAGLIEIRCKDGDEKKEGEKGLVLLISDDGAGIDIEALKSKIMDSEVAKDIDLEKCTNDEILQKIFMPGFSTKKEISHISGMGVGLDSVMHEVKNLGGTIRVDSTFQKGTTFRIEIPFLK